MTRPSLEDRLLKVCTEVSADCHADIGSDHALLPLYLLNNKISRRLLVTEKSPNAFRVARQALWGRQAEVFLGDGMEPLAGFEFGSVSLCGMGGSTICEILQARPELLPDTVISQANRDSHKVRRWAYRSGYHLVREQLAQGRYLYEILTFRKASGIDPAYQNIEPELAFHFGPHLLRQGAPLYVAELEQRFARQNSHPENRERVRLMKALQEMVL